LAVKLRSSLFIRFLMSPWGKASLLFMAVLLTAGVGSFTYFYVKYAQLTDAALKAGPFANMSLLYAAPRTIAVGDEARGEEIAAYLRQCGYSESNSSREGWYRVRPDAVEVNPGPDAYDDEGAVIKIDQGHVSEIISLRDHSERNEYYLEPELITNLFDTKREKRRKVYFDEIPQVMVDALRAAEDEHFFEHAGFDPLGILRAIIVDVIERKMQGASTLTQQLARMMVLENVPRGFGRKIPEFFITVHLEKKLTKKQIFEYYANNVYLGNQGSFSINGFGEGAQVYFGKDLSHLTLPEAALLAGLIQSRRWDPFRHPESAKARRNIVLKNMRENNFITPKEYEVAAAAPLDVNQKRLESTEAPYFVDLVNTELQNHFQDQDFHRGAYRVYTTLDTNLQRDAEEAMRVGIAETDAAWKRRSKKYGTDEFPPAQAALVALDARTGAILALVGGRNYGVSQLNHALAQRPTGSSFKPFVYATAMETGLEFNAANVLTPASTVVDEPTTFWFEQQPPYEPADFDKDWKGTVTFRFALAHSLNVPAVKVAEMVGYDKVARMARRVGLNAEPTPAIALGAYDNTPLAVARAYTVFPNAGQLLDTTFIKSIRDQQGAVTFDSELKKKQVIDPRVTYLVENMMEDVLRYGTGGSVRSRGFTLPAAGKTGTSPKDGWFAGFTSKIICVVWVGFDDNRDFKLEGARSALPIWVEFMKRAHQHREYRNVHSFEPPDGITTVDIDADSGELPTSAGGKIRSEVFIAGTQPVQHGNGRTQVAGWDPVQEVPASSPRQVFAAVQSSAERSPRSIPITPASPSSEPRPKKGFLGWVRGIFK
jgi:penicillin-binding protein 1B